LEVAQIPDPYRNENALAITDVEDPMKKWPMWVILGGPPLVYVIGKILSLY
jgi:hypothetical protein